MKRIAPAMLLLLALLTATKTLKAQTLTLNDALVTLASPQRGGINLATVNFYDSGQMYKNLLRVDNWNFEPMQLHQIFALTATGTTTSFSNTSTWTKFTANTMAGATFSVVDSQLNGPELGCSGTIASNTTGNGSSVASVYTIAPGTSQGSSGCAGSFKVGDIVLVYQNQSPTPEACWESNGMNCSMAGSVANGGKLTSDTITPYAGKQSLVLNVGASTSAAADARFYFNANTGNIFVLMNGTYTVTGYLRLNSGTATPLNILVTTPAGTCTGKAKPTTSWAPFTVTCAFNETNTTKPNNHYVDFYAVGSGGRGAVEIDDVGLQKVSSQDSSNTTVFRDEVVDALKAFCATDTAGPGCPVRNWTNQNGETTANWTASAASASMTFAGASYTENGEVTPQLGEYLELVKQVGGIPYFVFPCTATTGDATNFIDYMSSTNYGSGYGAVRASQGQQQPWVGPGGVFSNVYVSFCNEAWNGSSFPGQSLPYRSGAPEFYYDYASRARDIFKAMRADSSFSTNMKLGFNLQQSITYLLPTSLARMALAKGSPDYGEIAPYTQASVSNWQTDAALWGSAMEEPWGNTTDPLSSSQFYQQVQTVKSTYLCGPTGLAACNATVYEEANSTVASCGVNGNAACTGGANTMIDQKHEDYITAGAGEGVIAPLQMLLNQQKLGITTQNYFGLAEYQNPTLSGMSASVAKLWGCAVDMGGSTSYLNGASYTFRPPCLGLAIANQSIIGPEFSAIFTSGLPTYNWAGDKVNGPTHALNNVPYLYAFCFKAQNGGSARSCLMINTSLTANYTVSFAGSSQSTLTCVERQFAPGSIDAMNEAPTGTATYNTPATVGITTRTISCPASLTLPKNSVTALDF